MIPKPQWRARTALKIRQADIDAGERAMLERAAKLPDLVPAKKRGGKRPGAGRKPLAEGEDSTIINARVTPEQAEKFKQLGPARLRAWIDKAKP
jgi:hypothetical protein